MKCIVIIFLFLFLSMFLQYLNTNTDVMEFMVLSITILVMLSSPIYLRFSRFWREYSLGGGNFVTALLLDSKAR